MEGQIGPEAKWNVEFKEGKLCAGLDYVGADASAGLVFKISADGVIDALKKAIPGHFDDAILDGAKILLKGL